MSQDAPGPPCGNPRCRAARTVDPGLRDEIRRHGWTVFHIHPDTGSPPFSYTLGLHETFGHPELLVVVNPEFASPFLHDRAAAIRDGARYRDHGPVQTDAHGNPPWQPRAIPRRHLAEWLGRGLEYYQHRPFPALQCVLLDAETREPRCPPLKGCFCHSQPVLSEMRAWPFEEPRSTMVFTTDLVLEGTRPILSVYRYPDTGEWQFLCGTTIAIDQLRHVSLADVFVRDPSLHMVSRLLPGWAAERRKPGSRWRVYPAEARNADVA